MIALGVAGFLALLAGYEAQRARAFLQRDKQVVAELGRQTGATRARATALDSDRLKHADALASQVRLTVEAPPPRALADLTALLPPDVRLDSVFLSYGDRLDMDVQVVARHAAAYDLLLDRLSEAPFFDNVLPGAEAREGEIRALIRMTWTGARTR